MGDRELAVRPGGRDASATTVLARLALVTLAAACLGLAAAQIPSGDPPPFIEAEVDVDVDLELPGQSIEVKGKININTDGLGDVIDAVIGALCRIFPCGGDSTQARAVLGTNEFEIGDARTGIVIGGGVVGIGDLFGGIVADARYDDGFLIRFASDAPARVRSLTFARDAFLTQEYLRTLGLDGQHFVPAGTYTVTDDMLRIPVRQGR